MVGCFGKICGIFSKKGMTYSQFYDIIYLKNKVDIQVSTKSICALLRSD